MNKPKLDVSQISKCALHNLNGETCYFKKMMLLMTSKHYSKLNNTVSIEMFQQLKILHPHWYRWCCSPNMSYGCPINVKCCGGHDENGYRCTNKITEPIFLLNLNKNQLARCSNHLHQPINRCDTLNYFTSVHQYYMCIQPKKITKEVLKFDNLENRYNESCDIYSKCKSIDEPQCKYYGIPMDYNNEIKFYCFKHHCQYLENRYNEFKLKRIELIRQQLQPKTTLEVYQIIMSKVSYY
jgi:hypothetical protein